MVNGIIGLNSGLKKTQSSSYDKLKMTIKAPIVLDYMLWPDETNGSLTSSVSPRFVYGELIEEEMINGHPKMF